MFNKQSTLKSLALIAALCTMAPLSAQATTDSHDYGRFAAGFSFIDDTSYQYNASNNITSEYDSGMNLVGAFGRDFGVISDFGNFRTEIELSSLWHDIDNQSVNGVQQTGGDGTAFTFSGMINVYNVFFPSKRIRPYIGAGLGFTYLELQEFRTSSLEIVDDSDTVIGYQGMLGAEVMLTKKMDMNLEYRYFATTSGDFVSRAGSRADYDLEAHIATIGLKFDF